jgi:predicted nucleotidyltransferase
MTPLGVALQRISEGLQRASVSFALVGGLAVSVRVEPRFTRDIDLAVAVASDAEAEALVRRLASEGWRVSAVIEQEAVNRLATVRLDAPRDVDTAAVVDLLFASSGIEPEMAQDAELLEVLPGVTLPVACVAHLIVLKLLARAPARPQDEADLAALLDVAGEEDLRIARRLAQLIVERGYHRGRDLVAELESAASSSDAGGG